MNIEYPNANKKDLIAVGMSGGVDSAVVAYSLKQAGYNIIGITMQLYDVSKNNPGKSKTCCGISDITDARLLCDKIGIPYYVVDYENDFKEKVIDSFVNSYINGETPVPCALCNTYIKFGKFKDLARQVGAKYICTGHYALKRKDDTGKDVICIPKDSSKDQTYFLFGLSQEEIDMSFFPLGNMLKSDVRVLAAEFGLEVSQKKDSTGICFVENKPYYEVVERFSGKKAGFVGDIVNIKTNKVIGKHSGLIKYTIGQRKGIGLSASEAMYVTGMDHDKNILYVGFEDTLYTRSFSVKNLSFVRSLKSNKKYLFKIRLSKDFYEGRIYDINKKDDTMKVEIFGDGCRAATPGQACVVYDKNKLIGGGFINEV